MANKCRKKCSTSLVLKEMKIQTIMRYLYTYTTLAKIEVVDKAVLV